jgi:hypothetical protein
VLALLGHDLREAPVRVALAELVERHAREPARFVQRGTGLAREHVSLEARGSAEHADARPAPRHIDVVRQRDHEAGAAVPRSLHAELAAQPLERRIERVEAGRRREETPMAVAGRADLLDPGEMEEGGGEVVSFGQLAALDLLPGLGPVWQVVAEGKTPRPERVENPASPGLHALGNLDPGRHRRDPTYPSAS